MRLLTTLFLPIVASCGIVATEPPPDGEDFETPLAGLSPELNAAFLAGDEDFERRFVFADGLGPRFNNDSCASCHPADGGGGLETMLKRFSIEGDPVPHLGGPQLQDRAAPGIALEVLPVGAEVSVRKPPPVFGVGFIEAISEESILSHADPMDSDGDGISGRPNWVEAAGWVPANEIGSGTGLQLGRFGLKANVSSLVEQVVLAYQQDMGVTSDFLPEENHFGTGAPFADVAGDPEIGAATVMNTVFYVRLLSPPAPGEAPARGAELFESVGCADCHVPTLSTGPNAIEPLSNQEVPLYSDLLLHDMGEELADDRPDGEADGREWRTTPLWGLRLAGAFNRGPFYLHDGRATSVAEAIEFHGGEGARSRDASRALSDGERADLIAFVESR